MADWKQIQARIRRARTGADPAAQLEKLFEKTQDAMAAFELAKYHEGAGHASDAVRWYETAAGRFRRADWKKKSEEALARLSGVAPMDAVPDADPEIARDPAFGNEAFADVRTSPEPVEPEIHGEIESSTEQSPEMSADSGAETPDKKRRRRGRRGGRKHRRGKGGVQPAPAEPTPVSRLAEMPVALTRPVVAPPAPSPPEHFHREVEEGTAGGLRGRSGDPGLASRLALLEMQLRRLLACPPVKIDDAARAPAGPGVFVVTDSDLVTYYFAESCKTLRIAIGSLLRSGGPGRRESGDSLKSRFADHLGIPEARVAKYVSDHCLIRWLQLDEGAAAFAHFTVALLRPLLNDWE